MHNEALTRIKLIDQKLSDAGWDVSDPTQVVAEYDIEVNYIAKEPEESYLGHQYSDYVLLGRDGKPFAVVEAKKSSVDASIGREQAKQYCYNIQKKKGGVLPFCFYTNGYDIFFWNLENYPPQKVYGFPTRDDLERFDFIRNNRKSLAGELINTKIAGREYQIASIRSVMESIEGKKRKFLLVMATGTGKTRTCIALIDALMRSGWIERTLFLVDRIALQSQTLDAFKEHLPNEPRWPKDGDKGIAKDRRIYVSTYPTMLNIIRDGHSSLSPHFFDLIIVDESHRSIYNTYQEILDYFGAITLGLTATPTNVIDHNTFQIFDCEDGIPTFAYSYEEAINHIPPYLSDYQVLKIKTKFQQEGINKRTISLEDQKKLLQEGKEINEINYEGSEIEKSVINKGTNALIVREYMEECIKDANGVLPGKTIIFCISKAHARRLEEIFDALYPQYSGELAKVIVSDDPRVYGKGGLLDQFTNNDMPRIAISVDMMDTGIDVREVQNLVFAKPVFSYTKFWQMIGRGTRLLEKDKIKPWCTEKEDFLILDCWENFEYFKLNPKGKELKPQIPLPVRLFGIRLDKIEKAIVLEEKDIAVKETTRLKMQLELLPRNSIVIMDAASEMLRLDTDGFWNQLNEEKISFLRTTIKPLLRTISGVDFKAMRFEKDVLEASLALLSKDSDKFDTLSDSIKEEISELPLSVNIVAREEEIIRKSRTNHYWSTVTDVGLDELTEKLAPLMTYVDSFAAPLTQEKLNLKDSIVVKEYVEFGPQHERLTVANYRMQLEQKINALLVNNPILQKIKEGKDITQEESELLAVELSNQHPHITIERLRMVYNNRKAQLTAFIKHILGLEVLETFPETVSKAFDNFIAAHSYMSARQLEFLSLLRSYLTEKGTATKKDLINAPFTRIHPDGVRGVFSQKEIEEIIKVIDNIAA